MYKQIASIGIYTKFHARHIVRRFGRAVRRPLLSLFSWVYILFCAIDFYFVRSAGIFNQEWSSLRFQINSASEHLREARKKSSKSFFGLLLRYIFKALHLHKGFFKSLFNTLLPLAMALVLIFEIHEWSGFTYALKVIYAGETIGYISNESVYLEARNKAVEKLSVGLGEHERADVLETPKYELSLVSVNKLIDTSILCDNLLHASNANITNACGVFLNGEFLCSVKNENDARSVFNAILEKQELPEKNATAGFLETVDYVQGLYPDNEYTMWDAVKLEKKLNTEKTPAKYYVAQPGDSFSLIASANGLTMSELKALNPDLGDTILIGSRLLVAKEENYVTPKIMTTTVRTEEVDYKTEVTYNSKLFSGDRRIIRPGQKGMDQVTLVLTSVDGVIVDMEEIDRVPIVEAVSEKVEVGTASGGGYYGGHYSSKGFVWPAPTARMISQYFGNKGHKGLDITTGGALGRPIVAAASGVVEIAGSTGNSYGQQVVINHGNGVKTRYAHCVTGSIKVRVGQQVSAGQQIASIGSTGNSTGPHLHFEVIVNGGLANPLNYVSR